MNDEASRPPCRIIGQRGQRFGRRAARAALAAESLPLLALLLATSVVHADIFKCTANKAMPTYQNFPCEFDSLGAMPATAHASDASRTAALHPQGPGAATPVATMPRVGMTTNEVKAIWGEPNDTVKEEYAKGDIETWTYPDSRSVRFDLKGRVSEIKW